MFLAFPFGEYCKTHDFIVKYEKRDKYIVFLAKINAYSSCKGEKKRSAMYLTLIDAKYDSAYTSETRQKGDVFERHFHFNIEFLMIINGDISVYVENKQYVPTPYTLVIIPPPNFHSTVANTETDYTRVTVMVSPNDIPLQIRERFYEKVAKNPLFKGAVITRFIENLKKLLSAQNNQRFSPLLDGIMTELFYAVAFYETDEEPTEITTNKNLSNIVKYINSHITEPITLDDISTNVFLSKSTISHLFKSKMNISIKQYILQKKMVYASTQIANGVPANEVAKNIGYDNYSNFFTIYKKIIGNSPSDYKNYVVKNPNKYYAHLLPIDQKIEPKNK